MVKEERGKVKSKGVNVVRTGLVRTGSLKKDEKIYDPGCR